MITSYRNGDDQPGVIAQTQSVPHNTTQSTAGDAQTAKNRLAITPRRER